MFASPSFSLFNQHAQENKDTLVSRKPGTTNSARKPLGDRSVNNKLGSSPGFLQPTKQKKKLKEAKAVNSQDKYPEWLADVCSFKYAEDTYEDIWPPSQRLNKFDFLKTMHSQTPPPLKTPPPSTEFIEIDPMFLELPQDNFAELRRGMLEILPVDEPDFPNFDFL